MNFNKSKDKKKAEDYNKKKKLKKKNFFNYNSINNLIILKKPNKLYEFRKIKRQKDLIMNKKISEKNKKSKSIIFENLKRFENKNNLNNTLISNQLKNQNDKFFRKLNKRRLNSVTPSTLSNNNSFKKKNNKKYKKKSSFENINIIEELEYFEQNVGNLEFDREVIFRNIDKTKTAPKSINV